MRFGSTGNSTTLARLNGKWCGWSSSNEGAEKSAPLSFYITKTFWRAAHVQAARISIISQLEQFVKQKIEKNFFIFFLPKPLTNRTPYGIIVSQRKERGNEL